MSINYYNFDTVFFVIFYNVSFDILTPSQINDTKAHFPV